MSKSLLTAVLVAASLVGCGGPTIYPTGSPATAIATLFPNTASSAGSLPVSTASPVVSSPSPVATTAPATATVAPPTATETFPVRSSDLTSIRMAPGPDGHLYVSIPRRSGIRPDGVVVALLDGAGKPGPGWPLRLSGVDDCPYLLALDDSRVRVVCTITEPPSNGGLQAPPGSRIFAFDANAQSLPGWPVETTDPVAAARIVGDDLVMVVAPYAGDAPEQEFVQMVVVRSDGSVTQGVDVPASETSTIGPDGLAFGTTHRDWTSLATVKTDVVAFDRQGVSPGWPITIDGVGSTPEFDAQGRIYVVVGTPTAKPARLVVLDRDGRTLPSSSTVEVAPTGIWDGAGGDDLPGPPIVAADGTVFIPSTAAGRTTVVSMDPDGFMRTGWPYQSTPGIEWTGRCGPGDTGCGHVRTTPVVGPGNILYLLQAAANSSSGGSVVAIGADGHIRNSWPVGLRRTGSMFWSVVVAGSGELWVLAIEAEAHGDSATILYLEADSTVVYRSNIVSP